MPEQPHPPSRPGAPPRGGGPPRADYTWRFQERPKTASGSLYPAAAGRRGGGGSGGAPPGGDGEPGEKRLPPANYAELHARSNFTFLSGASHPDELVDAAAAHGYAAIAVADVNTLAGVVRAHAAAKKTGVKLLVGAEVQCLDAPPCVLLAEDRGGYANLCRLLTTGRRRAEKGACELKLADACGRAGGLFCGVPLPGILQDPGGPRALAALREAFAGRCVGLAELRRGPEDRRLLARQLAAAKAAGVPAVAAGGALYHAADRRFLHDVLTGVRLGRPVSEIAAELEANGERHLKSRGDLLRTFHGRGELLDRTVRVADRCRFSLDELKYEYPGELIPAGTTAMGHLNNLVWLAADRRYGGDVPEGVRASIHHELALIQELNYPHYFLTVHDLVEFARSRGILCQGRGAAANSAVCFVLGITSVDPAAGRLLFERFISKERDEPPDIDVDFEHERREEVIQYVYSKYGRDRAGMTATVITYRPRSALRDVGKALGLSLDRVDSLAKNIGRYGEEGTGEMLKARFREVGFDPDARVGRQLMTLVRQVLGFPRHLSQHTGGMVISQGRLDELCPVENAAMADRTIIQWDKDDLDALGLLKIDILALGMLTAVRKCFDLLDRHGLARELMRTARIPARNAEARPGLRVTGGSGKSTLDLADVPGDDPATFRMIRRAETVGVFQIESRAQRASLPRTRPVEYYDLVVQVALVRPGPIQGGMVHPYIDRRRRGERSSGMGPDVDAVLGRTFGVPIFQEQCLKLSQVAAGFSAGEAEQLRRCLSGWRKSGKHVRDYETKLKAGLARNGYAKEFADRLFEQIKGFGEYGFPESHAASFARLTWVSCYLKCRHPAAFFAALLNSQPMGFYQPSQLIKEARRQGVAVRPPCANASDWDCTLEPREPGGPLADAGTGRPVIRLGLRTVSGLPEADARRVEGARRRGGAFASVAEVARRTGLRRGVLDRLAAADAFAAFGHDRRRARWHALPAGSPAALTDAPPARGGGRGGAGRGDEEETPDLPALAPAQEIAADYAARGSSLRGHPLAAVRPALDGLGAIPCRRLAGVRDDGRATVAGLILMRQRPGSARGVTFITIEDETGEANLVLWPAVWERFHRAARTAAAAVVAGRVQRDESRKSRHLIVDRFTDLRDALRDAGGAASGTANAADPGRLRSRDFH